VTTGETRVVPAGPAHAAVLAELHRRCFDQGGWSPAEMLALIDAFGAFALIAIAEDEPAGLALARVVADEGEVLALGVLPDSRRRGIGGALLSALSLRCAARGAARIFLEVACDNAAAQALYLSGGFVAVGRRSGYYARADGSAADGLILANTLLRPCAGAGGAADVDPPRPRRPRDPPPSAR
jgi:ribosomal-protein-alanine N-acetyltransferase